MISDILRRPGRPPAVFVGSTTFWNASLNPVSGTPLVLNLPAGAQAGQTAIGYLFYHRGGALAWQSMDGLAIGTELLQTNDYVQGSSYDLLGHFQHVLSAADITRGNLRFTVLSAPGADNVMAALAVYKTRGYVAGSFVSAERINLTSHQTFNFTVPNAGQRGTLVVMAVGRGTVSGASTFYGMVEPSGWTRRVRTRQASSLDGGILIDRPTQQNLGGGTFLMGYEDTSSMQDSRAIAFLLKTQ